MTQNVVTSDQPDHTANSGPSDTISGPTPLNWQFAYTESATQLDVNKLNWLNPRQIGGELIKENVQRQVWRIRLGEKSFYLKLFLRAGRWWRLKRWLRGPACLKEWRVARYACEKGINCVRPVAYALCNGEPSPVDCLLITEGIPKSASLTEYWDRLTDDCQSQPARTIAELEDAVAELLAKAHEGGIAHSDLHPGNLLVEPSDPRVKVHLVDLHSIRTGRAVSHRVALENLAQLNQWFRQHATITQRMRLLKRYMVYRHQLGTWSNGTWAPDTFKHWARLLGHATQTHSRRLWASRDRRVLKTSRYFTCIRLPNYWRGHVFLRSKHRWPCSAASHLSFRADDWKRILECPEALVEHLLAQSRPIKHSRSALVSRGAIDVGDHRVSVVCKRHIRRKPLGAIWDCLRHSRCLRAWKLSYALLHRGIPVAQPLAVLERRIGPYLADSLLITEEVKPSLNLRVFLTTVLPAMPRRQRQTIKPVLMDQLAALLRRMYRSGFVHRDMKATNILVQGAGLEHRNRIDPDKLRLVLVDLHGLRLKRRPTAKDELRPLVRLSLSADLSPLITMTDRVRFLKAYLTHYGSGLPDWRTLWRQIENEREGRQPDHVPQ